MREVAADALLREVEDDLLGPVDELGRLADALAAETRDLLPGAGSAPRSVAVSLTICA